MSFCEKSFVLISSYIQLMLTGLLVSVQCLLSSNGYSVVKMAVHQYQVIHLKEPVCDKNKKSHCLSSFLFSSVEHVVYVCGDKSESEVVNGI